MHSRGIMAVRGNRIAVWSACAIFGVFPYLFGADIGISPPQSNFHLERTMVPSGAELVTLFSKQSSMKALEDADQTTPILSVLRDTLDDSDPENDRLRQVWIYSYAKPSVWQRFVACLPFVYRQASPRRSKSEGLPSPVLDLAAPGKNTMRSLFGEVFQAGVLDDLGVPVRLVSRSYRGNSSDYRDLQIYQALLALSDYEKSSARKGLLTPEDMEMLGARLALSTRVMGGIVSKKYLQSAWDKELLKSNQNRGHNWELLRQKAEESGLYFEPLSFGTNEQKFALLWIEQASIAMPPPKQFDKKLLGINNPFTDRRLREWSGYTQTWYLDDTGLRVEAGSPSARAVRMIPLALYALDHPRLPLLLVDMRQPWKPGTKERARRIATDITTNLLRLTPFSNWQFSIAKSAFFFVRGRHGSALYRSARLRAYAQLQHSLKFETSIDPDLHREIVQHAQRLGLNPFDRKPGMQVSLAQGQHAALRAFAISPDGLAARLNNDRAAELDVNTHSTTSRAFFKVARTLTFGLYKHAEQVDPSGYSSLDQYRRFSYNRRFLERVLQSGTQPDVAWGCDEVRQSIDTVLELGEKNEKLRPAAGLFVSNLFRKSGSETLSRQCESNLPKLQDINESGGLAFAAGGTVAAESVPTTASESAAFSH
jgi:hypothetical protein